MLCFSEQKVIQYEQYVRDLQAHNRAVANCHEAPNGISYQDLQQEVLKHPVEESAYKPVFVLKKPKPLQRMRIMSEEQSLIQFFTLSWQHGSY